MPQYPREFEVDRIMRHALIFGWEKVKEEQIDDYVHLTIRKKFPVEIEEVTERPAG